MAMDWRHDRARGFAVALLLAGATLSATARAQGEPSGSQTQAAGGQAPVAVAETQAAAVSEQAPAAASETAQAEAPIEAVPAVLAQQRRERDLQLALGSVQRERAETSTLSAWLFTAVGVGVLVTGLAVGTGEALGCQRSCSSPSWPGWFVVGGATLTTAGIIWIERKEHDIAELESRRFQLEQELQRVGWSMAARIPARREPLAALTFRGSF